MKGNVILTDKDLESCFFSKDSSIVISVPEIKSYSDEEKRKLAERICEMGDAFIVELEGTLTVFDSYGKQKLFDYLRLKEVKNEYGTDPDDPRREGLSF